MDLWLSLGGLVRVTFTAADPVAVLAALENGGVTVRNVQSVDELTFCCILPRTAVKQLRSILRGHAVQWQIDHRLGIYWHIKGMLSRPVLLFGILITIAFWFFLPSRIFFLRVEGNVTVPTNLILEKAEECGIGFGTERRAVRSEKMKNALLAAIPQLQWAGINTAGCVATISVRERESVPEQTSGAAVSSIIALRDGVIQSCTVTKGSAACKAGQAVKAGQVLISGYTDCGISIRAERASGEIYAVTDREITLLSPLAHAERGEKTSETKKYSLRIGKKQINFYKGSGILDAGCVKMYEENYLTIPGGFCLPVVIITETWVDYDERIVSAEESGSIPLSEIAENYLNNQMIAGTILQRFESIREEDGVLRMDGKYSCTEMIGVRRDEELILP